MNSRANTLLKGPQAVVVESYDATGLLNAPFTVLLKNSVQQVIGEDGEIVETIIPDPDGLVKAVAQARVMHSQKLNAIELKFLRSALAMKSKDFAQAISVTPEHMSRLESGDKVLSPQCEMLVRIYTFAKTLRFTRKREANVTEIGELVGNVFGGLNIKPCHPADDELVLMFARATRPIKAGDLDNDGLWDEDNDPVAA